MATEDDSDVPGIFCLNYQMTLVLKYNLSHFYVDYCILD